MSSDSSPISDEDNHAAAKQVPPAGAVLAGPNSKVVDSVELMDGANEILISHKGAFYRLRETRSGKLILQK